MYDPNFNPYVSDPSFRPYVSLIIGLLLSGLAVMETLSGEALGRYGRSFTRLEEPNKFWGGVAISYLGGAFGIGYFLYKTHLFSK
ncbi:MAG: hypothetical protein ABI197_09290 [Granulicella sp.]